MKTLTKFKFPGIDKIKQSYSQSNQDLFVLSMLNGQTDGVFLELGGAHPTRHNNTYLLESSFNWSGISMDNNMYGGVPGGKDWRPSDWKTQRPNTKLILDDALNTDYSKLLKDYDKQLDYLQLDIDCNVAQLEIMKKIIKTGHRFSVITFETDFYSLSYENDTEYVNNKKEVKEVFEAAGYKLLVENVGVKNGMTEESSYGQLVPFEDWWIDVSAIDKDIYSLFEDTGNAVVEPDYIFKCKQWFEE